MQGYQQVQYARMLASPDTRLQFELATLPLAADMQLSLVHEGDGSKVGPPRVAARWCHGSSMRLQELVMAGLACAATFAAAPSNCALCHGGWHCSIKMARCEAYLCVVPRTL